MARRRIKVADFRGEPMEIEFPDGTVYLVRGDIPMEVVTYMADLEERSDSGPEDEVKAFEEWIEEGRGLLTNLVREGAAEQRDAVLPVLSPHELLGVMGSMIGGETVGIALARAMADGVGDSLMRKREAEAAADPTPRKPKAAKPRQRRTAKTAA